jgi:succinoglycan biosynthesis transport protein ExoP
VRSRRNLLEAASCSEGGCTSFEQVPTEPTLTCDRTHFFCAVRLMPTTGGLSSAAWLRALSNNLRPSFADQRSNPGDRDGGPAASLRLWTASFMNSTHTSILAPGLLWEYVTSRLWIVDTKVTHMDHGPLDLRDYGFILSARKWGIITIVATTTAVALAYSLKQTPVYTSSAEVIVLPASFDPNVSSAAAIAPNMRKEEEVANSAPVERRASLSLARLDIASGTMSVSQVEDADTLVFTSVSPRPRAAQATAQAYADSYLELRRGDLIDELDRVREPYESQIDAIDAEMQRITVALQTAPSEDQALLNARFSLLLSERLSFLTKLNELATPEGVQVGRILRSAARPRSPSAPNHIRNGLLGLFVGFALGIGVAFFRDRLDDRVRGRAELELLSGAPVLALIPRAYSQRNRPVTLSWPTSEAAEAFKSLGVRLLHVVNQRATSMVITSSVAGEGKTSVTADLGVTLAQAGKRVVIVAADLRKPRLQTYFEGSDGDGLTEMLTEARQPQIAISTTDIENLWILHAGGNGDSPAPSDLLGSQSMIDLLTGLRDLADFVLIDTPPLLATSDVVALAPRTDGVLFVVDPRLAHRSSVEQARHELELIGVPVIGVVVNKYDPRWFRAYGSGDGYYGYGREEGSGGALPRRLQAIPVDPEQRTVSQSDRDTGDSHIPRTIRRPS